MTLNHTGARDVVEVGSRRRGAGNFDAAFCVASIQAGHFRLLSAMKPEIENRVMLFSYTIETPLR
jgi:hypothetical protein